MADVHERTSGIPMLLEAAGAQLETRSLTNGDYVVGPETIVERKSVADLHATIAAGRFWPQMKQMRDAGRSPCLILEGRSLDDGAVVRQAIRGLCLAVCDLV